MKINVNFDLCTSNAVCMGVAPALVEVRDDGYLYVLNEQPGEEFRSQLEDAVKGCPNGAISISED